MLLITIVLFACLVGLILTIPIFLWLMYETFTELARTTKPEPICIYSIPLFVVGLVFLLVAGLIPNVLFFILPGAFICTEGLMMACAEVCSAL